MLRKWKVKEASIMVKVLFLTVLVSFAGPGLAEETYESLQDFCLKTGADTPENCQCGQETADAILSEEEQAMALAMMAYQQRPQLDTEQQIALMAKLNEVTAGCGASD